jgi:uncharacterized protein (TIGR03032 family)
METNPVPGTPPPPFTCSYTPQIPELLERLGGTLAISTYQAGKVLFLSSQDDKLIQLPRTFPRAMAVGIDGSRMAVATKDKVHILGNEATLAVNYPNQPGVYDGLYVPRSTYYTGNIDCHGLEWGSKGLWAVNTLFSCLCLINENFSFEPVWKPSFISDIVPEDRCHLNGMAMSPDGEPEYVTAFSQGDTKQSWRTSIPKGGVVIHVPSGEILAADLPMPHSPRLIKGKLYLLTSGEGELLAIEPDTGRIEVVRRIGGFVRGMAYAGEYMFIGLSKIRENSSTFKDLPIVKDANTSGFVVIHLPSGAVAGSLTYQSSVDEIFDICFVPGTSRPGIVSPEMDLADRSLVIPGKSFWAIAADQNAIRNGN